MLELTVDEKNNLVNKIETIKNFQKWFSNDWSIRDSFFTNFSLKEVCSDEFINDFYGFLIKNISGYIATPYYIFRRRDNELAKYLSDEATVEDRTEIINKIISTCFLYCSDDNGRRMLDENETQVITGILLKVAEYDKQTEWLVKKLIETSFFKKIRQQHGYGTKFIDNVISKGTFNNVDEMINLIKENYPEYHNFPIIIFNKNIEKNIKIAALKKVYTQKDFPKYKEFFKKNNGDFSIIDDFVQATIFQNARIKEKEANFILFLKRVFIDGESSYYYTDTKEKYGANEFLEKYSDYFKNPSFVRKLYMETVAGLETKVYIREKEFKSFINNLFKEVDARERLKICSNIPEYKFLVVDELQRFYSDAKEKNDQELRGLIFEACINWCISSNSLSLIQRTFRSESILSLSEEFPESGKKFFNNLNVYSTNSKYADYYEDIRGILDHYRASFANIVNKDLFKELKFFNTEDIVSFGYKDLKSLKALKDKRDGNFNNEYLDNVYAGNNVVFNLISNYIQSLDFHSAKDLAQFYYDRFIKYFNENEEAIQKLTNDVLEISNYDTFKNTSTWSWGSNRTPTVNAYISNLDNYKKLVEVIGSKLEIDLSGLCENINSSIDAVKLIANLN